MDQGNNSKTLDSKLRGFNALRIFICLAIVLYIALNVAALAVFIVFLVLFVVNVVKGSFINLYLFMFTGAIATALINNLWFLFKIIKTKRNWRVRFKHFTIPYAFSEVFEEASFDPEKGIDKSVVNSSGIVNANNRYQSDDLIVGKYKGVSFTRSDVNIQFAPKRGSSLVNIFAGQWMIFDFNKPIDAYVSVLERSLFSNKSLAGIFLKNSLLFKKNIGISKIKVPDGQKIKVEDVGFNRKFEVVTRNPHTAFYILTPQFIEAVKFLEKQISGQLIMAFFNGKLHVALNSNNNDFEAKLLLSAKKNLSVFNEQVLKTAKFIDILRLDNDYFKE